MQTPVLTRIISSEAEAAASDLKEIKDLQSNMLKAIKDKDFSTAQNMHNLMGVELKRLAQKAGKFSESE